MKGMTRCPSRRSTRWLWWLLAIVLALWAGSWRVIYLEVTRWHHMDSRLRFTPPPVPAGAPLPKAGLPVIAARSVALGSPPVAVVVLVLLARLRTPGGRAQVRNALPNRSAG